MFMLMQLYLSFVRRRRKLGNYKSWDKYSWADYLFRSMLSKTFYARHLPQKDNFGDLLPDPKCWSIPVAQPAETTTEPSNRTLASINAAATATIMDEWDSDNMEWVSSASKA